MKVAFGPASWIGLVGALAAACAPVFSSLPMTWGATVAAVLASVTIIGRQLQAIVNTKNPVPVDELEFVDEPEIIPTDISAVRDGLV
jgi:hypothetical protein